MLVLDRKAGQSVLLYPNESIDPDMTVAELFSSGPIQITIKSRDEGTLKLAITAPKSITILRDELEDK